VDTTWITLLFPAGTPREVLLRVNTEVRRAMERPAVLERLRSLGLDPIGGDLPAPQAFVAAEVARWRDVVRTVNIQRA
jgi:tripartite-type tricarboxylate transporter receptor subunit TctC